MSIKRKRKRNGGRSVNEKAAVEQSAVTGSSSLRSHLTLDIKESCGGELHGCVRLGAWSVCSGVVSTLDERVNKQSGFRAVHLWKLSDTNCNSVIVPKAYRLRYSHQTKPAIHYWGVVLSWQWPTNLTHTPIHLHRTTHTHPHIYETIQSTLRVSAFVLLLFCYVIISRSAFKCKWVWSCDTNLHLWTWNRGLNASALPQTAVIHCEMCVKCLFFWVFW